MSALALLATVSFPLVMASPSWASAKPAPVPSAATDRARIIADWDAFFLGTTPASRKIALLQDGPAFSKVIESQATSPLARSVASKVSKVTLGHPPTEATVVYTITIGGKPALTNVKGEAVLQNGTWKVSVPSFCALLALEGVSMPACKAKP